MVSSLMICMIYVTIVICKDSHFPAKSKIQPTSYGYKTMQIKEIITRCGDSNGRRRPNRVNECGRIGWKIKVHRI